MIESSIKTCKDFILNVLKMEDWFYRMINNNDCDLLLLTGTTVEKSKDKLSDIDIFLVCKYEVQIKYFLSPVYIFNHGGKIFEISILSTEKLFLDRYNKDNIHWWHHSYIIESFNKEAEKALSQASSLTKKEFLDRLWTNFVYFKINTADIEKQIKRKELISVRLLFNENIKLIMDSELTCKKEFPSLKQLGRVLQQENQNLYNEILYIQKTTNFENLLAYNNKLQLYIIKLLQNNGFSDEEINNWEKYNLKKITFQYR